MPLQFENDENPYDCDNIVQIKNDIDHANLEIITGITTLECSRNETITMIEKMIHVHDVQPRIESCSSNNMVRYIFNWLFLFMSVFSDVF